MAKRGRKPALTKQRHEFIIGAIRSCVPKLVAARASGIAPQVMFKWVQKGKAAINKGKDRNDPEVGIYVAFAEDYAKAEHEAHALLASELTKSVAKGDVATARWMLERRYSKYWGQRSQVNVSGGELGETGPIEFTLAVPKTSAQMDGFGNEGEDDTEQG